jgi:hypothetical protein
VICEQQQHVHSTSAAKRKYVSDDVGRLTEEVERKMRALGLGEQQAGGDSGAQRAAAEDEAERLAAEIQQLSEKSDKHKKDVAVAESAQHLYEKFLSGELAGSL